MNLIEILERCKLFSEVPAAGFQRLATIGRICRFPRGRLIFREGDECPGVYVVGRGMVRIFKTGAGGKEHVLHLIGPGSTFAEAAAIGGFDVPASAEAVEDTTCALLPLEPLRRTLEQDHEVCLGMMRSLTIWVRQIVGLMEDVVLRDAAGRLARYLLDAPEAADGAIELPGLKRHVASHLNLTSETFSRTLRRFVEAGLIAQPDTSRLELLDRQKLRQVAEGMFPRI